MSRFGAGILETLMILSSIVVLELIAVNIHECRRHDRFIKCPHPDINVPWLYVIFSVIFLSFSIIFEWHFTRNWTFFKFFYFKFFWNQNPNYEIICGHNFAPFVNIQECYVVFALNITGSWYLRYKCTSDAPFIGLRGFLWLRLSRYPSCVLNPDSTLPATRLRF